MSVMRISLGNVPKASTQLQIASPNSKSVYLQNNTRREGGSTMMSPHGNAHILQLQLQQQQQPATDFSQNATQQNNIDLANILDSTSKNRRNKLHSQNQNSRIKQLMMRTSQVIEKKQLKTDLAPTEENEISPLRIEVGGLSCGNKLGKSLDEPRFSFGRFSQQKIGPVSRNFNQQAEESEKNPKQKQSSRGDDPHREVIEEQRRRMRISTNNFSPMLLPIERTGYQTHFKQRESRQSTQKLPKIVTARESLSLGHYTGGQTEHELLLSQNLNRINKKMRVEVTHSKQSPPGTTKNAKVALAAAEPTDNDPNNNYKRLYIVVQPRLKDDAKKYGASPSKQSIDSPIIIGDSCIDIRSATPDDSSFWQAQKSRQSNVGDRSDSSTPNTFMRLQSCLGTSDHYQDGKNKTGQSFTTRNGPVPPLDTSEIHREGIQEETTIDLDTGRDPNQISKSLNMGTSGSRRGQGSSASPKHNLLAQALMLKRIRQSPAQEKFQKGKQYQQDMSNKFMPQPPNVVPSFPRSRFVRQVKKAKAEASPAENSSREHEASSPRERERRSKRERIQQVKTLVQLSKDLDGMSDDFSTDSPTETLRMWMNAMAQERIAKKQRIIELEHNPFEESLLALKAAQRAKNQLANKLTSPPNTNKKLLNKKTLSNRLAQKSLMLQEQARKKRMEQQQQQLKVQISQPTPSQEPGDGLNDPVSASLINSLGSNETSFLRGHQNSDLNLMDILEQVEAPNSSVPSSARSSSKSRRSNTVPSGDHPNSQASNQMLQQDSEEFQDSGSGRPNSDQPSWSHQITVKMSKALELLMRNHKNQIQNKQLSKQWTRLSDLPEQKLAVSSSGQPSMPSMAQPPASSSQANLNSTELGTGQPLLSADLQLQYNFPYDVGDQSEQESPGTQHPSSLNQSPEPTIQLLRSDQNLQEEMLKGQILPVQLCQQPAQASSDKNLREKGASPARLNRIDTEKLVYKVGEPRQSQAISRTFVCIEGSSAGGSSENELVIPNPEMAMFKLNEQYQMPLQETQKMIENVISVRSFKSGDNLSKPTPRRRRAQASQQFASPQPSARQIRLQQQQLQREQKQSYQQIKQVAFHGAMMDPEGAEDDSQHNNSKFDGAFHSASPAKKSPQFLDTTSLSNYFFTHDDLASPETASGAITNRNQKNFREFLMAASQMQKRPNKMVDLLIKDQERIFAKDMRARFSQQNLSLRKYPNPNVSSSSMRVNERKFYNVTRAKKVMSHSNVEQQRAPSRVEFTLPMLKQQQLNQQSKFDLLSKELMQCSDFVMLRSMQEELGTPKAYQNSTLEANSPTISLESPRSPLFKVSEELKAKFTPQKELSVEECNIPLQPQKPPASQSSKKSELKQSTKKSEAQQVAKQSEDKQPTQLRQNAQQSQLSPVSDNATSGADINVESLDACLNPIGVPSPENEHKVPLKPKPRKQKPQQSLLLTKDKEKSQKQVKQKQQPSSRSQKIREASLHLSYEGYDLSRLQFERQKIKVISPRNDRLDKMIALSVKNQKQRYIMQPTTNTSQQSVSTDRMRHTFAMNMHDNQQLLNEEQAQMIQGLVSHPMPLNQQAPIQKQYQDIRLRVTPNHPNQQQQQQQLQMNKDVALAVARQIPDGNE